MGHTYKETDASETWCKVRRQRANAAKTDFVSFSHFH